MKTLETRNSKLTTYSSRLFAAVCLLTLLGSNSFEMKGQSLAPTTSDILMYSTTTPCTGGCAAMNFYYTEHSNTLGHSYIIPYVNSGSHKMQDWYTFVTDYDRQTGSAQNNTISHWNSPGTAISTALNASNTLELNVYDPDVVQMPGSQQLKAVYYTNNSSYTGIPGNSVSLGTEQRVRLETFLPGNPPITFGPNVRISFNSPSTVLYVKNPNIDVSLNSTAAIVWEEMKQFEANNHIYARILDDPNTLSSNFFDLNPKNFEYEAFYNPDVACAVNTDQPDNYPVYITFMASKNNGSQLKLMVYYATVGEIRSGAAPNANNLFVVDPSVPVNPVPLAFGDAFRDYFYRPRIATLPNHAYLNGSNLFRTYNIVLPRYNGSTTGTSIMSYTSSWVMPPIPPYFPVHITNEMTNSPMSFDDISSAFNFDPTTEANSEGYEVVWNFDRLGIMSLAYSGLNIIDNPTSSVLPTYPEQTVLRKRLDWIGGTSFYPEYSRVPLNANCCFAFGHSVSFDRALSGSGNTSGQTSYFFFDDYNFTDQKTYYKDCNYTNSSLKWAGKNTSFERNLEQNGYTVKTLDEAFIINSDLDATEWKLYSMDGRQVIHKRISSGSKTHAVNTSGLAPGLYVMVLHGAVEDQTIKLMVK